MVARRLREVSDPVEVTVDGRTIVAQSGEPLAVSLVASGRWVLSRSVKYHRPRGPICFRGECDGCLMRVDGEPSRMTCRVEAAANSVAETQNVIGSAERDLLAVTDWFFRKGLNHHEMFTWNEQVNRAMQKVARRVAGIGELPDAARPIAQAEAYRPEVVVIGGGPAGLSAATTLAEAGIEVALIDEETELGGSLRWHPDAQEGERIRWVERVGVAGVRVLTQATVVGIYQPHEDIDGHPGSIKPSEGRPVLLVRSGGRAIRIQPQWLVVATGRRDQPLTSDGADTPAVVSVGAACRLLAHGVLVGERPYLVGTDPRLYALKTHLEAHCEEVLGPVGPESVARIEGRLAVSSIVIRDDDGGERESDCDAVVVGTSTSVSYEIAAQAGVKIRWLGDRYELAVDPQSGRTDVERVFVVGSAASNVDYQSCVDRAAAVGRRIAQEQR